MEIKIEIEEYSTQNGLKSVWEPGFEIFVKIEGGEAVISANKAGLISLAKQLLTLAQETVPPGCHLHFDEYNSLSAGSSSMVIEKAE